MAKTATISASEFKARCLKFLDQVRDHGGELLITKRGKAVAKLVPVTTGGRSLRGAWKGIVHAEGDIVGCDWTDDFEAAR